MAEKREKTGGRVKGTPNKATAKNKENILLVLDRLYEDIETDILLLKPKDRVDLFVKLSEFITPKQKAIEITDTSSDRSAIDVMITAKFNMDK